MPINTTFHPTGQETKQKSLPLGWTKKHYDIASYVVATTICPLSAYRPVVRVGNRDWKTTDNTLHWEGVDDITRRLITQGYENPNRRHVIALRMLGLTRHAIIDIDTGSAYHTESFRAALAAATAARHGILIHQESSSSGGWHFIFIWDHWIDTVAVEGWIRSLLREVQVPEDHVGVNGTCEIFPNSRRPRSYVRVPFQRGSRVLGIYDKGRLLSVKTIEAAREQDDISRIQMMGHLFNDYAMRWDDVLPDGGNHFHPYELADHCSQWRLGGTPAARGGLLEYHQHRRQARRFKNSLREVLAGPWKFRFGHPGDLTNVTLRELTLQPDSGRIHGFNENADQPFRRYKGRFYDNPAYLAQYRRGRQLLRDGLRDPGRRSDALRDINYALMMEGHERWDRYRLMIVWCLTKAQSGSTDINQDGESVLREIWSLTTFCAQSEEMCRDMRENLDHRNEHEIVERHLGKHVYDGQEPPPEPEENEEFNLPDDETDGDETSSSPHTPLPPRESPKAKLCIGTPPSRDAVLRLLYGNDLPPLIPNPDPPDYLQAPRYLRKSRRQEREQQRRLHQPPEI